MSEPLGSYLPTEPPVFDASSFPAILARVREPLHVVQAPGTPGYANGAIGLACGGQLVPGVIEPGALRWLGTLPPLYPEWLGDRSFCALHGTRFAYVAGAMANGIASTALVKAMANAGMLGFFGAAGLSLARIEQALQELSALEGKPYGCNLIHAPHEPLIEAGTVELLLKYRVRKAEAAAFMALTQPVVRYALTGLRQLPDGSIHRENYLFAKISRPEVARRFLSPAPKEILDALVAKGQLSPEEARLAQYVPIAEDITVESDSGGHTDNRPLNGLFPLIAAVRDQAVAEFGYTRPIRVGAAGGIGTPMAAAAAFSLGAAYIVTGSVNQATPEAGTSRTSKELLCKADIADVAMAPAADMFELGVEVQVLKRGTLFASRAHKLYALYNRYDSLEAIPEAERVKLEREVFRSPLAEIWDATAKFFAERNPEELKKASQDAHHKMALVFRWYLGQASKWAIQGEPTRAMDYQIWCGPAQGAFNAWVKGTFLEPLDGRLAAQIALNLLEGASVITRAAQVRSFGVAVPAEAFTVSPRMFEVVR